MESAPHSFTAVKLRGTHGTGGEGTNQNENKFHQKSFSQVIRLTKLNILLTCLSHRPQCPRAGTFIVMSCDVDGQGLSTVDALYGAAVGHRGAVVAAVGSLVAEGLHGVMQSPLSQVPLTEQNVRVAVG